MALVLVVDDVLPLAKQYAYDLGRVGGYETIVATGGEQALRMIAGEAIDCVILDLEMPGVDGFEVLRRLKEKNDPTPVIVYTGTGDYDRCAQAIRLGAYSFIDKAESMERVAREVANALERSRLEREVRTLRRGLETGSPIVGSSAPVRELRATIERLAPVPSPVLITGESGSGKELVARELHRLGPGDSKPFIALNSSAIPEHLVESELFGHERGAFTGADRTRKGAFELASGGTLFLDEIGELPAGAQAKLLRVIEERVVTRVGGGRTIAVDARVVAATNRDLEEEVRRKGFRKDLLFRIDVHQIRVPPLRERRSDIPELAAHLVKRICGRLGVREKRIDPGTLDLLMAYDWKRNNIRELRNIIERMIIASDGDTIAPDAVPAEIRPGAGESVAAGTGSFQDLKAEAERRIIVSALERTGWQITRTAADLGLADHASLLKIMRRHDIRRK
ncbi:MAG: sigma-54 dependent transcriptional regulator [Candidatus Krumholzibacteria bacterium]|nr:sigma-54 dependent transcriptional regulator [Candidatus Krumholzibacteria bacterium]